MAVFAGFYGGVVVEGEAAAVFFGSGREVGLVGGEFWGGGGAKGN